MSISDIDDVMIRAEAAFRQYSRIDGARKAAFLREIAIQLEALGDTLIATASAETHLPEGRLKNERSRTTGQLNAFAQLLTNGDWVQATIEVGDRERKPMPKADLRKMLFPLGAVVVFGASNFPLAFSTAGGDTASALAAGCSVVVKSHPAHPKTSALVASAIAQAMRLAEMPDDVFQHIEDGSIEVGQQLVKHPLTKAAAFTGSYTAGKALFDLANARREPIPLFAEMGSVNPVVLLPGSIRENKDLSSILAASVTLGVGQFCTNPGIIIVMEGEGLDVFLQQFAEKIGQVPPAMMLHSGIAKTYYYKKRESLEQRGVVALAEVVTTVEGEGSAALALVEAGDFLNNDYLHDEVFGPYSLIVKCKSKEQLHAVVSALRGQLTATVFGTPAEINQYNDIVTALQQRCGRLIFNGVPTGVDVSKSMHHGGPFPATTDARFTSVGTDAIYRFVRPVCFQDFPDVALPAELKNVNEGNILRCVNGTWSRNSI